MKIAMLTYSVKPRGGVEHALAVAEALAQRDHEVCVCALAQPGERFFRETAATTWLVEHVPTEPVFDERILAMVAAYRDGLRPLLAARRLRHRPRPGLHLGQRRAGPARRGRHRARRAHRASRRRVHLPVADRLPGPLDPHARPRAVRLPAVDRAPGRRVRRRRPARAKRGGLRPLPPLPRRGRADRRPRRARPGRPPHGAHRRGHRAAQGIADAAGGLRRAARPDARA